VPDLRTIAEAINRRHDGSLGTRALAPDYRLVGLTGEVELARLISADPDLAVHGGDGGKDNYVWAAGRRYKVDAKTSRLPHLGMLVALPARADIYVFFGYPEMECWGWNWRAVVERASVVDKGHNLPSYDVPVGWLRDINELLRRIEPEETKR
jgi:hypothetical protein